MLNYSAVTSYGNNLLELINMNGKNILYIICTQLTYRNHQTYELIIKSMTIESGGQL